MISECFAKGVVSERFAYHQFIRRSQTELIPLECAVEIIKNAHQYPAFLVAAAESKCRERITRKIVAVSQVAQKEQWFMEG